jgi:hypothetical protein
MLFTKPLAEIDESDLQTLVDNGVREGKEIEYKEALTLFSPEQKQEFLNDVSSFANTNGGLLFYGIRESKDDAGVPLEVCGLKGENPGKRINDMETIIRTGLEPRLLGVTIWSVSLPSHEDQVVLILSIPKSFAAPHMVKSSGRFYSRNSTGKFQLDVTQIRAAFELAGTTAERIRAFRTERLSRISSGVEIPAPLIEEDPKLVLHLIPLNAFSTGESFDLKPLYDGIKGRLVEPISVFDGDLTVGMRFNIDGFVRSTRTEYNATTDFGYTQVFRNGIVETVDTSLLMINAWNRSKFNSQVDPKAFDGERYERKIVVAVKRYLELQKFLGSNPPFFVMVSFLGVKGYKIALQRSVHHIAEYTSEIDRNNLIIPEVMIEDFDVNVAGALRPIFDAVWNAAGSESSPNYDETGQFRFND